MIIFAPVQVNLLAFKINYMDHESQNTLGSSAQIDLLLAEKRNLGWGANYGDANIGLVQNGFVFDPDALDADAVKESII